MKTIGSTLLSLAVLAASAGVGAAAPPASTTPIQHLVVIFQETTPSTIFATYPVALNPPGEPRFRPRTRRRRSMGSGTLVDGEPQGVLLTDNPNALKPANGASAINPFRLDRSQATLDCDNSNAYAAEQFGL